MGAAPRERVISSWHPNPISDKNATPSDAASIAIESQVSANKSPTAS
jgi:hypothetical protein